MLTIASHQLSLAIIDPSTDAHLMGSRYCWGGYIWAVTAADGQPLTTGPRWGTNPPPVHHGQGLPEVFRFWAKDSERHLTIGSDGSGVIIGVGSVQAKDPNDHAPDILAPARWNTDVGAQHVTMRTSDTAGAFAYTLERRIEVNEATITVATEVSNAGGKPLPVHWYAHPFFPPAFGEQPSFRITGCTGAAGHAAYPASGTSLALAGTADEWGDNGHFAWLDVAPDLPLNALIRTPAGAVGMRCSHPISRMPVWANQHTLSLEPYIERELAPGAMCAWTMQYDFGASWTTAEVANQ